MRAVSGLASYYASVDGWTVLGTFFVVTLVSLVAGVWLLWKLRGPRRLLAPVLALGFPLATFPSADLSVEFRTQAWVRRGMESTAQALHRYHAEWGKYPERLDLLRGTSPPGEPLGRGPTAYSSSVSDSGACPGYMWEWYFSYDPTPERYTLAYSYGAGLLTGHLAPRVCRYASDLPDIRCGFDHRR